MIKNEHQLAVTASWVEKFEAAVAGMDIELAGGGGDRILMAERAGLRSKADKMRREIAEYKALRSGRMPAVDADDPVHLPEQLIKARIALGMTQRELAERAGMPERRVQEYERTDYESAGYAQLVAVRGALLPGAAREVARGDTPVLDRALSRIKAAGLGGRFVDECIAERFCGRGESAAGDASYELRLLSRLRQIYGWAPDLVLGNAPLRAAPVRAAAGIPAGADPAEVRAHAAYARYVAGILDRAAGGLRRRPGAVQLDPRRLREDALEGGSGAITLPLLVECAWGAGIAVGCLPPLAFPVAHFAGEGLGSIVLARRGSSESGLMLDLARCMYCAGAGRDGIVFDGRGPGDEGPEADEFAHAVLVGPRADAMFRACMDRCTRDGGALSPEMLARAATETALEEGARADSLADYMAYRLEGDPALDWRGAAQAVRVEVPEWRRTVALAVGIHADIVGLSNSDFDLLHDAMGPML